MRNFDRHTIKILSWQLGISAIGTLIAFLLMLPLLINVVDGRIEKAGEGVDKAAYAAEQLNAAADKLDDSATVAGKEARSTLETLGTQFKEGVKEWKER